MCATGCCTDCGADLTEEGAVGHHTIELARWAGAATIVSAVGGPEKAELARRAEADLVG